MLNRFYYLEKKLKNAEKEVNALMISCGEDVKSVLEMSKRSKLTYDNYSNFLSDFERDHNLKELKAQRYGKNMKDNAENKAAEKKLKQFYYCKYKSWATGARGF